MENSGVVQIHCTKFKKDLEYPFQQGTPRKTTGTGFFFEAYPSRYILTCSHVVQDAVSVSFQSPVFGKRFFDTTIVAMCPEFDIALLMCSDTTPPHHGHVSFCGKKAFTATHVGDTVQVLGYPLGQDHMKMTQGIISGHQFHQYQIDSPINPGNSGGPVMKNGKMVGIIKSGYLFSNDIGYAIPVTRIVHILPLLKKRIHETNTKISKIVHVPTIWGITYQYPSCAVMKKPKTKEVQGIEIVSVSSASVLRTTHPRLESGDCLEEISWNGQASCDIYGTGELSRRWMNEREHFQDVLYFVDYSQPIVFRVRRKKKRFTLTLRLGELKPPAVRFLYQPCETIDYMMIGGLVILPLCLNVIDELKYVFHDTQEEQNGDFDTKPKQLHNDIMRHLLDATSLDSRHRPRLIVMNILQGSEIHKQNVFRQGDLLTTVNNTKVNTLDDLRRVLIDIHISSSPVITIMTERQTRCCLSVSQLSDENKKLCHDYSIPARSAARHGLPARSAANHSNKKS